MDTEVFSLAAGICESALKGGGFASYPGEDCRPDETAWAAAALAAAGLMPDLVDSARSNLAASQMADGRITLAPDYEAAFWPTAVAVLAWRNSRAHSAYQDKAAHFLLSVSGKVVKVEDNSIVGHDTTILGWPWIDGTTPWVEPTAMALIALELCGKGGHERARDAVRLIMDRQLRDGGWNYGNPMAFGQTLLPAPLSTGMALCALAGKVERAQVSASIDYLAEQVSALRSPKSLAWSLLGLAGWNRRPFRSGQMLAKSRLRQERLGRFRTTDLALLLLARIGENGLLELMASPGSV